MNTSQKLKSVDSDFWNIVKGIGIILVVVGHFWGVTTRFVYVFHLPLFFFRFWVYVQRREVWR